MKKEKTLFVRIKKLGWTITGKFVRNDEIDLKKIKYFEIVEATENAPHNIGEEIFLSSAELKYYTTYELTL